MLCSRSLKNGRAVLAVSAVVLVVLMTLQAGTIGAAEKLNELYRSNAMAQGLVGTGATANVDIKITRLSTEEEEEELLEALRVGGPKRLHSELRNQKKVGFIAVVGERGYPLYYADLVEEGGKKTYFLATDRPIDFFEAYWNNISLQFPFTLITMTVDAEGNGTGQAILGAEVIFDEAKDTLNITNYDALPVRLEGIRRVDKKKKK